MPAINLERFRDFSEGQFEALITGKSLLQVEVICPMGAQDPLDVAREYLEALFIGEQLAQHSKTITVDKIEKESAFPNRFVVFTIMPNDSHALYLDLIRLSNYIAGDDDDDTIEFLELLTDFEEDLAEQDKAGVRFPELFEIYQEYVDMSVDDDEE